jgi:hypothetical protein
MGKQMEGDNRQRRRLARLARKLGKRPSELQATTGASKQREHEERDEDHAPAPGQAGIRAVADRTALS